MEIVYQDNHIIIAEKPARIGVGTDSSNDGTFLELIREYYQKNRLAEGKEGKGYCVPIHFLDRPVSGVMVFATSSKSAERINKQFKNRTVKKKYMAVVEGTPKDSEKTLIDFVSKNHKANKSWVSKKSDPKAKLCELSYKLVSSNGKHSLLEVYPKTGRSHQIRVQLSNMGHPIVGDVKYGSKNEWHKRIALHSHSLGLTHPVSKKFETYEKKPPGVFEELI